MFDLYTPRNFLYTSSIAAGVDVLVFVICFWIYSIASSEFSNISTVITDARGNFICFAHTGIKCDAIYI